MLNTYIIYLYVCNINAYLLYHLSIQVLDINRDRIVCIFDGDNRVIVIVNNLIELKEFGTNYVESRLTVTIHVS